MKEKKKIDLLTLNDVFEKGEDISLVERWLNSVGIEDVEKWDKKHSPDYNSVAYSALKKNLKDILYKVSIKDWIKITGTESIVLKGEKVLAPPDLAFKFEEWVLEIRDIAQKRSKGESFGDALDKIAKAKKPK